MKVISLQTGDMFVNCYIVYREGGKEAVVIDPGGSEEKIIRQIEENKLKVTHILLTHGHFDHIGALKSVKEKTGAAVCVHSEDAPMLTDPNKNLSFFVDSPVYGVAADTLLKDGDVMFSGGLRIKVLHTPGHSEGSVCYIIEDALFTGDTLFYMYVGRTDFPGSSYQKLKYSVNHILGGLQTDYTVYPGHGIATSLAEEKISNSFFDRV